MTGRRHVLVAAGLWAVVVLAVVVVQRLSGTSTVELAQRFVDGARGNWWALLAYAALATIRPVVLFPATLLTIAAGVLFGPAAGIVIAALSANGSALLAYRLGRRIGPEPTGAHPLTGIGAWAHRLRVDGFEAVLVMRLLFLPYDLVSYVCGMVRVPVRRFLLANAIGTLPGTVAFVLIGASVERLDEGIGGIDRGTLAISVALTAASILGSRVLRRRSVAENAAVASALGMGEGR